MTYWGTVGARLRRGVLRVAVTLLAALAIMIVGSIHRVESRPPDTSAVEDAPWPDPSPIHSPAR